MAIKAAVITISDGVFRNEREDRSGPVLKGLLEEMDVTVMSLQVVPDEKEMIAEALALASDSGRFDLVVTTGGTGLTPRDVTPEATAGVIDRDIPGIAEAIRRHGCQKTPFAALSRGKTGLRGMTLIVNLPGSQKAVREGMDVLRQLLHHAVEKARGEGGLCGGV